METSLMKEMLGNVARWRNSNVVVYVSLPQTFSGKDMEEVVNDIALLVSVGVKIIFACKGENNKKFLQLARQQKIPAYDVKNEDDLLKKIKNVKVVKLFFLCEVDGVFNCNKLVGEMTVKETKEMLKQEKVVTGSMKEKVQIALNACEQGVKRVHFVNGKKRGAFLEEFLSGKGSGTMIYTDNSPYKKVRKAKKRDVFDIARMLRNFSGYSTVTKNIEKNLESFLVFAIDDCIHATMMVSYYEDSVEVDFLASSEELESLEPVCELLQFAITEAQKKNKKFFYIPANRALVLIGIQPWFLKLGFESQFLKTKKTNDYTKVWVKSL